MRHSKAWIIWLVVTTVLLLTTRNPVYLFIILGVVLTLGTLMAKQKTQQPWLKPNLRFLVTMLVLSALINTLFTHVGESVLFTLPDQWLLIGGDITLESLVYGLINGLVIGALYITFNIFNLALSIKQITRLIPNVFHPIVITMTISLTFFPSIQRRAREIKEAQLIRGNPMKRISDWLPLLLPLLITSLEKAFLLSESMTARGFHNQRDQFSNRFLAISLIFATFFIFSGWILRLYAYSFLISFSFYLLSGGFIVFALFYANRKVNITHYHRETWSWEDVLSSILLVAAGATWITLLTTGNLPSTAYTPLPKLLLPQIQFQGVLLFFAPMLPLLFHHHD